MITFVTLNPAIDEIYYLNKFNAKTRNRIDYLNKVEYFDGYRDPLVVHAGGKGVGSAICLQKNGIDTCLLSIIGGYNGQLFEDKLRENKVTTSFVYSAVETRRNTSIFDNKENSLTELIVPGMLIKREDVNHFVKHYESLLSKTSFMVLCGSIPVGVDASIYHDLIEKAHQANIQVLLYTSGQAFEMALKAGPKYVIPELDYITNYYGKSINSQEAVLELGNKIISANKNIEIVVLPAMFDKEIYFIERDYTYKVSFKEIEHCHVLGMYDQLIASFTESLKKQESREDMYKNIASSIIVNLNSIRKLIFNKDKLDEKIDSIQLEEVGT